MSIRLVIAGNPIDVPSAGENPAWGSAMVAFFRAVESAFNSAIGPYDIPLQTLSIDGATYNPTTSVQNVTNLSFSIAEVRAAFIQYAVYRATDTTAVAESGSIIAVYNTFTSVWNLSQDKVGDASITFTIDSTGQIQFETTSIAGSNHTATITYKAWALTNS